MVKINGRPAAEALAEQEQLISGATPQHKRYYALQKLGAGAKDSEITLDVLPATGKAQTFRIDRTLSAVGFLNLDRHLCRRRARDDDTKTNRQRACH